MSNENRVTPLDVLSAGYALHIKPFEIPYVAQLNSYLFRLQTEGKSKALVDGFKTNIKPGDLLLYGVGEPYELAVEPEPDAAESPLSGDYYIFIRGEWMDRWWGEKMRPQKISISLTGGMTTLFRQIASEWNAQNQDSEQILENFMIILCRYIDRAIHEYPKQGHAFIAYQMKRFIEENATRPFTLEEIASHFGISISRAVHLFKQVFGQSIMQYALDIRISLAKERIIHSPLSLHYVAETSGFASYTYFFRVFRKRYGMSPGRYREQHGDYQGDPAH